METKEYVSPTWISLIGVPSFFISLVGFFLAIWWVEFRWRIFFTSIYFLVMAVVLIKYDLKAEEKFVEEQKGVGK